MGAFNVNDTEKYLTRSVEQRVADAFRPINRFIHDQTSGAFLLIVAVVAAMVWVNSPWKESYQALEEARLGFFAGPFRLEKDLHEWINDGLMVLFFFALGLEVKREFIAGELREIRKSAVVICAAVGGMAVPAIFYVLVNFGESTISGWGVPMATDTAFALGVLAFLGDRISPGVKTFLVALAIVDDIGAVLVIAFFYTDSLNLQMLLAGVFTFVVMLLFNFMGVRRPSVYFVSALVLWYCTMMSGIHATVAGVLAALAIPARPRLHPQWFAERLRGAAGKLEKLTASGARALGSHESHELAGRIHRGSEAITTPLQIWESRLSRPVSLFIVPVFAFFNAGIEVSIESIEATLSLPVGLGILAGLVLGKPIGIFIATWLATRGGWLRLPERVSMSGIAGLGLLAGMGFTMSVFVSVLSFGQSAEALLEAKTAITLATIIAAVAGMYWLSREKERACCTPTTSCKSKLQ